MTGLPLVLAFLAAILHALWNAIVKGVEDRAVALGMISLGHVIPAFAVIAFVPSPGLQALPYIAASTVIHWGYYVFLVVAYRYGELSFVYPVARGLAPIGVAAGALLLFDETLPMIAWAGIFAISAGVVSLAAARRVDRRAVIASLATAFAIAAYSVIDGIGIRISDHPIGYIAWLFAAEITVVAFVAVRWTSRIRATAPGILLLGFAGGIMSGLAYALVLYAKTLAPLGYVSAIRETSVVFASLLGVLLFGEGPAFRRLAAAAIVAAGVILLSIA